MLALQRPCVDQTAGQRACGLDVVVAGSALATTSLRQAEPNMPIVFANVADPVGGGLIASLRDSGSNVTGFTAFEYATAAKWLELLKEIASDVTRVAFVYGGPQLGQQAKAFTARSWPRRRNLALK